MIHQSYACGPLQCTEHFLPVEVEGVGEVEIYGKLCWRGELNEDDTVQVVIHGGTYSSLYWHDEEQPWINRYPIMATNAGFVTFTIDRMGNGRSTHPPGDLVTTETNADAVYGVVQALRAGDIGGVAFNRFMAVGHCSGSLIAIEIAANQESYPGAFDGLILTGFIHAINFGTVFSGESTYLGPNEDYPGDSVYGYPSYVEPSDGWEDREKYYYDGLNGWGLPTYRDDVMQRDVETLGHSSLGDIAALGDLSVLMNPESTAEEILAALFEGKYYDPQTLNIDVPVLIVVGEFDGVYCSLPDTDSTEEPLAGDCSSSEAILALESDWYSEATCLEAVVIPGTGHSINLHTSAFYSNAVMNSWALAYVGNDASKPPFITCP